jgi:geranylgeranyl diphosphate synthase, type I
MSLPSVFSRYHAEVNAEIKSLISERQSPMYDMMRYHLGWIDAHGRVLNRSNGKAVRPTLCLLTCEAVGGEYRKALPLAAAVELVHNYSLIHDDIQDDDIERRHQPTVWRLWGKPQAINAGTVMRMLAGVAVRRLEIPCERQVRIQSLIDEATIKLIEGQYLDISFETKPDISVADYLDMIGCKTAALISCSVESGAELGTDDRRRIAALREFGWNLGMAFQTKDDILGIWGRQDQIGKPTGNDIRHRKKSLPVILGVSETSGPRHEELRRIYNRETLDEESVRTVIEMLESAGALKESQRITVEYIQKARDIVNSVSLEPSFRRDIDELVTFLMDRDF